MPDSPALLAIDGAVATITLNRPDVLNAIDEGLIRTLRDHVDRVADDPAIRAVVLTGAGRGFCAGADLAAALAERAADPQAPIGDGLRTFYHPVVTRLVEMEKPLVTAVNGVAAGAGMSLALAGDVVIAGRSAEFLQAFAKIGLVPDVGSTWLLPRAVGGVKARALTMLAEKIGADEAERLGMVWRVVADDQLAAEAAKTAARLAAMPTRALAMIKRALNDTFSNTLAEQLEVEADLQTQAGRTEDFREGVAAFLGKRPPAFKGR